MARPTDVEIDAQPDDPDQGESACIGLPPSDVLVELAEPLGHRPVNAVVLAADEWLDPTPRRVPPAQETITASNDILAEGLLPVLGPAEASDLPQGRVVRTEPPEGTTVPPGSTVVVFPASGLPDFHPDTASDPLLEQFIGLPLQQAHEVASSLGYASRVGSIDGRGLLLSTDLQDGRLTFDVVNDVVTDVFQERLPPA